MSDVRRISEFLPEVIQTDVLKKFFAATADHMFQPDRVEYLNAYVGQLPPTYDVNADARVTESTPDRVNYQVEPSMVSRLPQSGTISHVLSYDDLINKLRYQGALVNDHNRLFQAEYYSYGLPIDPDKLINYTQYVWSSQGPQVIRLLSETNLSMIQGSTLYTYQGDYLFTQTGETESVQPLVFTSGLRVQFSQDIQVSLREQTWIVQGVGSQIRLIPESSTTRRAWDVPSTWDSTPWGSSGSKTTPAYVTIARGSANGNPWSRTNRWFHKQVFEISRTSLDSQTHVGERPILEFDHSITLFNFGTLFLQDVNLVDNVRRNLDDVVGMMNVQVDGVTLDDGQIILFTNLSDPELNNKLYAVSNVRVDGKVSLNQLPVAVVGDVVFVIQGDTHVSTNWYYSGSLWVKGQSRQIDPDWQTGSAELVSTTNQAPVFVLFDSQGERLDNAQKYPQNNFTGCTLVSYAQSDAYPVDELLGIRAVNDVTSARNYLFDVTCTQQTVQYYENGILTTIPGYYYWQQMIQSGPEYVNNWFKSDQLTKQYVVNEYVSEQNQTQFTCDQAPSSDPTTSDNLKVIVGTQEVTSADYTISGTQVTLHQAPEPNTVVKLKSYAGLHNQATQGYFEIPTNLQANPDNQIITQFKISQILPHLQSVLRNQTGFVGDVQGTNNWRDSAQNQGRGTVILQHRAGMLRLMALNGVAQNQVFEGSQSVTDPMVVMQWSQSEYLRYYNKFVNALFNMYNSQALTGADDVTTWLNRVFKQINLGKTRMSAWANSGVDQMQGAYCSQTSVNPTWTPTSAARLGATPVYKPEAYYDFSQPVNPETGLPPLALRCHNGAVVMLVDADGTSLGTILNSSMRTQDPQELTHPVAKAWMQFELLQYESMPATYTNPDYTCALDVRTIFSGKYRKTSYTRSDLIRLQAPAWNRWLTLNQVDALRNTTFSLQDPFSWNYSGCVDADNELVPGNWRGIYFHFYDTDEPHLSPWYMLGFSQKPDWWDSEYGAAPYTRGNLKMWQDLTDGRIAQGARQGVHVAWSRPGLINVIPVNDVGELLPPFEAGVVTSLPSQAQAAADWKFGDRSPMENVWLTSVDADQLWAQWAYLARPAAWVEYLWNGIKQIELFPDQSMSQWVDAITLTRKSLSEQVVHRENPSQITTLNLTETYKGNCGVQHWFSEKLISESRNVTQYLGDVIRGAGVNLLHKMGGFTDGANLRVLVDSFGLSNVDNLLLPQEDVNCELLRSASLQEYVYTGVLVEFLGRNQGWRVIGYDPVDPHFDIIPSLTTGAKQTVVVENQQVTEYKQGQKSHVKVPYGTVFQTRQQVYDFLISLGRSQESAGWQFTEFDSTASKPRTWSLSAREFLYWSQGPWAPGTYITLSPLATLAKFSTLFGIIQHIGGLVNGTHSVMDRLGNLISLSNLDFLRMDNEIQVKVLNDQGIYGLRLYTTSLEHALVFNNLTVFDDLIYDPVFNQRQLRFKLFGYRTLNWQGRLQAPGYLVTQSVRDLGNNLIISNRIIPNLEKTVNDLRKVFEIDLSVPFDQDQSSVISQALPSNLLKLAQHQIGYQSRSYLTELLLEPTSEFQFYQGMIKQKGTNASLDSLLRNTQVVKPDQEFAYFEEWAVRSGQYGYDSDVNILDVILPQQEITSNPQLVEVLSADDNDEKSDDQITILKKDSRIVNSSGELGDFKLRDNYGYLTTDLPTAGPVFRSEVTYAVVDAIDLLNLYEDVRSQVVSDPRSRMMQPGDRVWQYVDPDRGWNVWKVCACAWGVKTTQPNDIDSSITTITTTSDHGLREGDVIVIYGVVNAGVNINNTVQVLSVWDNVTFDVQLSTSNMGNGGTVWQYVSVRFSSVAARNQAQLPGGWQNQDLAWVDGDAATPWTVSITNGRNWFEVRTEIKKTDPRFVQQSRLYDLSSLQTLQMVQLWDPVKNKIPGSLDKEISYKTAYDPAQYTVDTSGVYGVNAPQAWGDAQVGQVWWDLSTTRYLDYEMGSNIDRRQNWGRIAPGSSIDVYEWVCSPVPPASWQNLVAQGADLSLFGSPGAASGTVKTTTSYVTAQRQTSTGDIQTLYYFWVRDVVTVPELAHRQLSVRVISQALAEPENLNLLWWAPISTKHALIGNMGTYLNADQTVWQIRWLRKYDVESVHTEYELVRPSDPRSSPPSWLWEKLGYSLSEYDVYGNPLPDPRLLLLQPQGVLSRPRQGVFKNTLQGRQIVVQFVNNLMTSSTVPPMMDPGRQSWKAFFESQEPEPAQVNQLQDVRVATNAKLDAHFVLDTISGETQLVSVNTLALVIDGITLQLGDRVLVKDQSQTTPTTTPELDAQNGVYVVVDVGGSEPWRLQRATGLNEPGFTWINAQVNVSEGVTQSQTVWHQISGVVLVINTDVNMWQKGPAPINWVQRVDNMAQLYDLSNTLSVGSQVLVGPDVVNQNKWTIWRWVNLMNNQPEWQLVRSQTFRTTNCWQETDWYLSPYSDQSLPDYTFDTLKDRDAFVGFVKGDLVKVLNTGDNSWALYVRQDVSGEPWQLVGMQSGSLQLSDNLWDYNKYNLGFGAQGFGNELLGSEYDTRREFEHIWKGLWVNASGTQGLLKVDSMVNEPNELMFALVNQVFSEQLFVDWAFKTSFINLRGFAEVLSATPLYTENKINSLIEYINEIKPYHVNVRSFVDWRKASDTYMGNFADFDKPPYADVNLGVRILDEDNPADQVILSSNPAYTAWYQNFMLNPQLVRQIKTRMTYDRVSCETQTVYESGYSAASVPDIICDTLESWLTTILADVDVGKLMQVHVPGYVLMTRNNLQTNSLGDWDFSSYDLNYQGPIDETLYDIDSVIQVLSQPVNVGYTVRVRIDLAQTWTWYVKTQPGIAWSSWQQVAYQATTGAAQRIAYDYTPTADQPAADSPLLISGCASKLQTLSGVNFQAADAWDSSAWDDPAGWDYSQSLTSEVDVNINSGGGFKYQLFVGDGVKTQFVLKQAPQYPTELQVWVDGRKMLTPQDWQIDNQISQVYVVNKGVGYSMNDLITIPGGQHSSPAKLRVTSVNNLGAVQELVVVEQGTYLVAPINTILACTGGTGTQLAVSVRWMGDQITFTQAPGVPQEPRPNIWIIEKGETFNPALTTLLDTTWDGGGLNRPHLDGGHPEELTLVWPRHNLLYDVYTAGTPGAAEQLSQVYDSDGVRTHFPLPAPVVENQQIWVFVNGELQTPGVTADYVLNYEQPQVVFVNAPASGRVHIHQISQGGASQSLAEHMITNPGSGYQLYDLITLDGAVSTAIRPVVQVTAVQAVQVHIVNGGANYQVGDQLLYKFGTGTQTLIVEVISTTSTLDNKGVIDQVQIVKPGSYTNLSSGVNEWYTSSSGSGAQLTPTWGVQDVFMVNRGVMLAPATMYTQLSVTTSAGGFSSGTGFQLQSNQTHVLQQTEFRGDGTTDFVELSESVRENAVWITLNGETILAWDIDSNNDHIIVFRFVPAQDDVVWITQYNSQLYSQRQSETLIAQAGILTYALTHPPLYGIAPTLNTQVFLNGVKLRIPHYARYTASGSQFVFDLGVTVSNDAYVNVWSAGYLQTGSYSVINGGTQIEFISAPTLGSDVLIQVTEPGVVSYDYQIVNQQLQVEPGVLSVGDQIQVVTFSEDSMLRHVQDHFVGQSPATYTLTQTPSSFASVQVYVNGRLQSVTWDYTFVQVNNQTQIQFVPTVVHTALDQVDVWYMMGALAKPSVAFRMWHNLFDEVSFYRLSDAHKTRISNSITWDAEEIVVKDGLALPEASPAQPGVVWLGAERIEYRTKMSTPQQGSPRAYTLKDLRRGSLGTPSGVFSDLQVEFVNGDGLTQLFQTQLSTPIVKVNGMEQLMGTHYTIVINPPGKAPGAYVQFEQDHVPLPGDRNIQFVQITNSVIQDQVSHPAGTWAQDGSRNQVIPAGYIWPYGDLGIQYSEEPQTAFLIAEPGTRHR